MGKAGTPYSRSCTGTHPLPQDELPDPGLVFDMLIRRDKVGFSFPSFSWDVFGVLGGMGVKWLVIVRRRCLVPWRIFFSTSDLI